jgi:4a-hydroxytetrahydrobiopterin dehydratase
MPGPASDLAQSKCKPCEGGVSPLAPAEVASLLRHVPGWEYANGTIAKTYEFRDHYQAMAFANAVAWISHREDHHPGLTLGYNRCRIEYVTHAINGLSQNDFICAAKVDALFEI